MGTPTRVDVVFGSCKKAHADHCKLLAASILPQIISATVPVNTAREHDGADGEAKDSVHRTQLAGLVGYFVSPWETRCLYTLGGKMQTEATLPLPDVHTYLQALNPHPRRMDECEVDSQGSNDEFMRLFKETWTTLNLAHWHYHSTKALDVTQNWAATSE